MTFLLPVLLLASQEDLEKAQSLSPDDKTVTKKLATLAKKAKQYEQKEKKQFAKMFAPSPSAGEAATSTMTGVEASGGAECRTATMSTEASATIGSATASSVSENSQSVGNDDTAQSAGKYQW